MQVEIPSIQTSIVSEMDTSEFIAVGINNSTTPDWLINYSLSQQVSFPLIPNSSSIHTAYRVGYLDFGTTQPVSIIIDPYGKIVYRKDGDLGIIPEIKTKALELIAQFFPK
jgi:hypothetical protein